MPPTKEQNLVANYGPCMDAIQGAGFAAGAARIKVNDPVRREVASIDTYWPKPGAAITHIQGILQKHGYDLPGIISFNDAYQDWHHSYPLATKDGGDVNSMLSFAWHKMDQSGKYEITAYLS
jgi:hypothetical protein